MFQENELWDKESNHSIGSWNPPQKFQNDGYAESHTASIYGRETYYEPAMSRAYSPSPSQHMMYPPPGYQSGRNTPMSTGYSQGVLHQPVPSRPATSYLDVQIPTTHSPEDADLGPGVPTDTDIDRAVQHLLQHADLTAVTKREVRRQLEDHFGMELGNRKSVINGAIDRVLLSRAS